MSEPRRPLTRVELSYLLDVKCFPKSSYSLSGSHGNDAVVIDRRGSAWVVFHTERGEEHDLREFVDEASACEDLLSRLESAVPPRIRWSWYLREQGYELEYGESESGVTASLRPNSGSAVLASAYGVGRTEVDAARSAAERWRLERRGTIAKAERLVSEAIVMWTGQGAHAWPRRDDQVLVGQFGEAVAIDLLPRVRMLVDEFYRSEAHNSALTLVEMGEQAAEEFRRRHPAVTEAAVAALTWCYTFDLK